MWHAVEIFSSVQIFPDYEDDHILGLDCWCCPDSKSTGDDIPIITHKDLAERQGLGPDAWLI